MLGRETKLSIAGVFRCCLHYVAIQIDDNAEYKPGDQLVSTCCQRPATLDEKGVWKWWIKDDGDR